MAAVKTQVLHTIRHKLSSTFIFITPPKSPVPHLLTSNATPTEDERKLILETVADFDSRTSPLMLELAINPNANIKKLQKQITVYQEYIRIHKALLVPIRNLPPELLQEIFLLYAETSTGFHRWIRPPFILGQICKSWRQAAISLPPLWNQLPAFKLSPKTRYGYTPFLEELIRRSGQGDTLRVYIRAPFKELSQEHPVITTLARHAVRIRTLTIESGTATVRLVGNAMMGKLVNLRQLELSFWTKVVHVVGSPDGEIHSFAHLPELRKVVLMGKCPPVLTLPWTQIEDYKEKYDGGMLNDCISASGISGTLQTLEVVKNAHHAVPMLPPLTLEGLKQFRVRLDETSETSTRFFSNLTLPAIESIQVVLGINPVGPLTSMLSHSRRSHSLRKLQLRGSSIFPSTHSATALRALFTTIPQLAELDIEIIDANATFLDVFRDSTPIVLPFLETLSIYSKTVEGMEETFSDIAQRRCETLITDTTPSPWTPLPPPTMVPSPAGDIAVLAVPPVDFDLISSPRPLRTLRLNFPTRALLYAAQRKLNRWHAPTSMKQTRDALKMDMWRREIIDADPEFFTDLGMGVGAIEVSRGDKQRRKGPKFPKRWGALLLEVENLDPMGFDRHSLRASNLHHTLGLIANAPSRYGLNERNALYIQDAKHILSNWRYTFQDDLHEYKWAIKGGYSLVYVTEHDPVRFADDAAEQLVYGLKDDLTPSEVFWPRNL